MKLRYKDGWPIVPFKGRHIRNLLRRLFYTDVRVTWRRRAEGNMLCPDCRALMLHAGHGHGCTGKPPILAGFIVDGWPKRKPKIKRKTIGQSVTENLEKVLGVVDDEIKADTHSTLHVPITATPSGDELYLSENWEDRK